MSGTLFPPSAPTTLQTQIPAYVFEQYQDDDNIQAMNSAFNVTAQNYLNWFNGINLPIYTQPQISGSLLDWVAQGIYGLSRPSLPYGMLKTIGPLNTWLLNTYVLNTLIVSGTVTDFTTNDDIFKRIITWFFFKGDGMSYSTTWLKRRIMRFLVCSNGTATNIDNTYPISVAFEGGGNVLVTITVSGGLVTLPVAQVFQAAVQVGAVSLPFQLSFTVNIVNNALGLTDVSGVLHVTNTTGWPTSASGLTAGQVWSNGGVVTIVSGITPNPAAPPFLYGVNNSVQLLASGGGDFPLTDPHNVNQVWNNAGISTVSAG